MFLISDRTDLSSLYSMVRQSVCEWLQIACSGSGREIKLQLHRLTSGVAEHTEVRPFVLADSKAYTKMMK